MTEDMKIKPRGFNQPVRPSPLLAAVIGPEVRLRLSVTKELWVYIRKHGLQDKENRRMINADELLRPIFETEQIGMFQMTKKISQHLTRVEAMETP
ncbi:MAG: SWIB/MDM2 domain-containing protein [Nitrospirales bacterium]